MEHFGSLSLSKAPKVSDYQKCKKQTTFCNIHNSISFVGQIICFKISKIFFLAFAYSSFPRCDLSTGNCPPSNARIPWLKKTMTSRLYQKRQKENLDEKLRFISDIHGPYKKPAEDVGFI